MSFLNVMLLGGAAAFLAPLMIHLLNRSRFQSIDWGAMHLLEAAMHVNSRRFQWENWLLLLLRCLIPILLAFCLARPVLTSLRIDGAGGKKSIALLIDNSLSMDAISDASEDTSPPLARALEQAESLVTENRSAEIGLWSIGGTSVNLLGGTTFDPARVRRSLTRIESGAGTSRITAAISAGIAQLRSMSNPSKQLILLSDFQASEWTQLDDAALDRLRAQLANGSAADGRVTRGQPANGATPIYLSLMRTAPGDASPRENLSISLNDYDSASILVGDSYRVIATVHNHGAQAIENARVVFSADDQELASRSVSIPAGATQDVAFACEFRSVGWHHVAVEVEESAGVAGDNIAHRAIRVIEPTKLLIVDPEGGQDIKHSSGFLQLALAPFRSAAPQTITAVNAFDVTLERGDQLTGESLRDYDVVVLANVPRLNDRSADAVAAYVQRGGGLVIFAGPETDSRWYNDRWFDQKQILAMKFGEKRTAPEDVPIKLAQQVIQAPLLDIFNSSEAGELSSLEISQWIDLQTHAPGTIPQTASSSAILLQLDNGVPLLAARRLPTPESENAESENATGGIVLQFATSCSDDWSNLPLRPVYVPLMQRIVASANRIGAIEANVRTGETLTLKSDAASDNPRNPSLPRATIIGPRPLQFPWDVAAQDTMTFTNTEFPGLYRVKTDDEPTSASPSTRAAEQSRFEPQCFTVALDPDESDLQLLSDDELRRIAERLGATVISDADNFVQIDKQRSDGQEIWRWLLIALLVFLFGEILLGQKITKGVVS